MKRNFHLNPALTSLFAAGVILASPLTGQNADEELNFIRESARFLVVEAFGTDNQINNFPTDGDDFASGVPFADFQEMLSTAYREGRGGIINFDNPIYSGAHVDYDRTAVRRFIGEEEDRLIDEGVVFDTPLERQEFINDARQRAYDAGLVDFSRRTEVVNRRDPGPEDPDFLPQNETTNFNQMIALFGPNRERELILRRGAQNYVEGELADLESPGSEDLGSMVNDNYYWWVGRSGYAGGTMRAMSMPFTFNPGMLDIDIDPRDNVTALGFILLSVSNFQYWQGLGGTPDNPDNIRVLVEFSDGGSELLTSFTRQSLGGWDTFFGVQAPDGTSITRLKVRIIGRNFRTFVLMDDLAFITEPAAPFLVSEASASAAVGRTLYYNAVFGQGPTDVSISGLPAGLAYDPVTQVISGTPAEEGTFTATFVLSNAVGTTEEEIEFTILPPVEDEEVPFITNAENLSASVTLGLPLTPLAVLTTRDEVAEAGELNFFTVAYRIGEGGARTLVPLEASGIGLADGAFSGTPTLPTSVGEYEVEVYVFNQFGGDTALMRLEVFPVVPRPNFDGNELTDMLWWDSSSNRLYVLRGEGSYFDADTGEFGVRGNWSAMDTGLTAVAPSQVALGDFDLNNQTDIAVYQEGNSRVDMLLFEEGMSMNRLTVDELNSGWELKMSGDLRGDGYVSLLWYHPASGHYAVWHTVANDVVWAGFLFNDGVPREFLLHADFTGDGTRELLFRRSPTLYELVDATIGTSTLTSTSVEFTMPSEDWSPHLATDLTGTGSDDLLWKNAYSGEVTVWIMGTATVPATALPPVEEGEEGENGEEEENGEPVGPIEALPGEILLPFGSPYEILVALDVDEDQRNDLILQDRLSGDLYLQLMDGASPKAPRTRLTTEVPFLEVVAAGDYNSDKREDILVRDPETGTVTIMLLGPEGVAEAQQLGTFGDHIQFVTPRRISTDLSLPPGRDDAVAPWSGAEPLGDRKFFLDWFGVFYDPPGDFGIYHEDHGWIAAVAGESAESIWLFDRVLGWLWTSEDAYPWYYWRNPIQTTWLYYERGTRAPRSYYFQAFGEWITDEELAEFLPPGWGLD
ncbi:MAG: VCBS repeat-containing protein [Opitutales bacterium]|nr:VCBS repeat-containing protein [Opitutales bacterium]